MTDCVKCEENLKPDFAFGKMVGITEHYDIHLLLNVIGQLLSCIKETNKVNNKNCEFFRLDFRPQYLDEQITNKFPIGALVLDLKFGSKSEKNVE